MEGMVGAVLIQFRDFQEGYLVLIQELEKIRQSGKKSINIEQARAIGMPLSLAYKRTRCSLDEYKFQKDFIEFTSKPRGVVSI